MDPLDLVVSLLPESSGAIRRCYWRNEQFRGVCRDLRDILAAQTELEAATDADLNVNRVAVCRELAAELQAEIINMLKEDQK